MSSTTNPTTTASTESKSTAITVVPTTTPVPTPDDGDFQCYEAIPENYYYGTPVKLASPPTRVAKQRRTSTFDYIYVDGFDVPNMERL